MQYQCHTLVSDYQLLVYDTDDSDGTSGEESHSGWSMASPELLEDKSDPPTACEALHSRVTPKKTRQEKFHLAALSLKTASELTEGKFFHLPF